MAEFVSAAWPFVAMGLFLAIMAAYGGTYKDKEEK